jgi:hypothetical protein
VGPAPLMVHPYAPAFLAAAVTAPIPGIRGALCGSTIVSDAEVKHNKKTFSEGTLKLEYLHICMYA